MASPALARALNALERLTIDEKRVVRRVLNDDESLPLRYTHLPSELAHLVGSYLEYYEIGALVDVLSSDRTQMQEWLDCWAPVIHRRLEEQLRVLVIRDGVDHFTPDEKKHWRIRMLEGMRARKLGHFDHSVLDWVPFEYRSSMTDYPLKYGGGRMITSIGEGLLITSKGLDSPTGPRMPTTLRFMLPHRAAYIRLWCATEKWLVATEWGRLERKVHAWRLSDSTHISTSLERTPNHQISISGDRVVFSLGIDNNEVNIWHIPSNKISKIKVPNHDDSEYTQCESQYQYECAILLHPTNPEIFYVSSVKPVSDTAVKITIYKYINGIDSGKRWTSQSPDVAPENSQFMGGLTTSKSAICDFGGTYSVGFVMPKGGIYHLTFNVYEEVFGQRYHAFDIARNPDMNQIQQDVELIHSRLWENTLIAPGALQPLSDSYELEITNGVPPIARHGT